MRRLSYLVPLTIVALLIAVPTVVAQTQDQEGVVAAPVPEVRSVFIEDYYFDPADAVVNSGATMLWVNQGAEPHTVTADDGSFDSGVLNPGDAFLVTVEGSGTLSYYCTLHPEMTGTVTVEGGAGAPTAVQETPPEETAPAEEAAPPPEETAPVEETTTTEETSAAEETPPEEA